MIWLWKSQWDLGATVLFMKCQADILQYGVEKSDATASDSIF